MLDWIISIFQHPTDENDGVERDAMIFKTDKLTTKQIPELSDEYTNMKPAYLKSKPVLPGSTIQFVGIQNHEYQNGHVPERVVGSMLS
jgi:hypothetical protein